MRMGTQGQMEARPYEDGNPGAHENREHMKRDPMRMGAQGRGCMSMEIQGHMNIGAQGRRHMEARSSNAKRQRQLV